MIVRVSVVLNGTVIIILKVAEISTTCAVVIFRVKVSCTISVNGIKLRSFKILLVIFQLSRYVIGYKVTR